MNLPTPRQPFTKAPLPAMQPGGLGAQPPPAAAPPPPPHPVMQSTLMRAPAPGATPLGAAPPGSPQLMRRNGPGFGGQQQPGGASPGTAPTTSSPGMVPTASVPGTSGPGTGGGTSTPNWNGNDPTNANGVTPTGIANAIGTDPSNITAGGRDPHDATALGLYDTNSPYFGGYGPSANGYTNDNNPNGTIRGQSAVNFGGDPGAANAITQYELNQGNAQQTYQAGMGTQAAQNLSNVGTANANALNQTGSAYGSALQQMAGNYGAFGAEFSNQGNQFATNQQAQGNQFGAQQAGQYGQFAQQNGAGWQQLGDQLNHQANMYGRGVTQNFGGIQVAGSNIQNQGLAQYQGNLGEESNALGNLRSAAAGNGPTAADSLLQQGTDKSIAAQMAIANSTRGSFGLAEAGKDAQATGANMSQQAVQSAAQLRAQEMQHAQDAYLQGTENIATQDLNQQQLGQQQMLAGANGGAQYGLSATQLAQQGQLSAYSGQTQSQLQAMGLGSQYDLAGMQYGQSGAESGMQYGQQGRLAALAGQTGAIQGAANTQIGAQEAGTQAQLGAIETGQQQQLGYNQAGLQGWELGQNLGFNAQQEQQQAQVADLNAAIGSQVAASQTTQNYLGAGLSAAGSVLAMADADLVEPGGPAHWTLREEPTFLLAKNQRTGEMGKVRVDPLGPHEKAQVEARHGAGPLGANDPRRQRTNVYSDADMERLASGGW